MVFTKVMRFIPSGARAFSAAARPSASAEQGVFARYAMIGAAAITGAAGAYAANNAMFNEVHAARGSIAGVEGTDSERTFMMVKPDGVNRGLIADIMGRMERRGYKLVGLKMLKADRKLAEAHYDDLKARPFFRNMVDFVTSGPVVAMVWEGKKVIKTARMVIGATDPLASAPGTIRGDLCVSIGRNAIHGSDCFATAEDEISLWFKPHEVLDYKRVHEDTITGGN
eukprot:Nk52_evm86s352 gene=Nk52_evmTU86s352